jgi:hypothetical protein
MLELLAEEIQGPQIVYAILAGSGDKRFLTG